MGLQTHGTAGSMPEEILARGTATFDDEFVAGSDLSDFQREVAQRLLRLAESTPPGAFSARAAIGRFAWAGGSTLLVNFVPRDDACAEMTVYVERSRAVHIGAGCETTFGLPDGVWDERTQDVPAFVETIVVGVATGRLRETIHYCGSTVVRSQSELDVEGIPVSVDRTNVGVALRGVLSKRRKVEITYSPYG